MDSSRSRARRALGSRDFRYLLSARLVSQFADGLFNAVLVTIIVFLAPEKASTAADLAKATFILVVPFSVVGPFAGVLIDRWSRRGILKVTPLIRAAASLILLPLGSRGILLYALALVVASMNRFYLATASAALPSVVREEDLLVANSMAAVGGTTITFVGLGVGTQLAAAIGSRGLLLAMVVLYPVAALLATRIRTPLRPERLRDHALADLRGDLGDLVAGIRRLRVTPPALAAIVSLSLDQAMVGIVTALSLVVFKDRFHDTVASYGRIVAMGGAGVLIGILTVGTLESRLSKRRIVAFGFLLAGVVCLAVSPFVNATTILLVSFTLGLTFAYRKIPGDTIVQEAVPDRYRGRVFAAYDFLYGMARPVGVALAIPLIPRLSTGALIGVIGAVYFLWTPIVPLWVGRARRVGLVFSAGGRADETPRALVVGGEEEPVELESSVLEEAGDVRRRRFRLRTEDGRTVEVWGVEGSGTWYLSRW